MVLTDKNENLKIGCIISYLYGYYQKDLRQNSILVTTDPLWGSDCFKVSFDCWTLGTKN